MKEISIREHVGVVIVNWNTCSHLLSCIGSFLREQIIPQNIVVVDQGSSDGSTEVVKQHHPTIQLVIAENKGYGQAVNEGVRRINTPFFILSNADILVHKKAIDRMLLTAESDQTISLVGCKLVDLNDRTVTRFSRTTAIRRILFETLPKFFRDRWRAIEQHRFSQVTPFNVTYVEGALMLLRRNWFDSVGGFDEGFSFIFEDVDLVLRMLKSGFRVVYVPEASVTHVGGASFSQVPFRQEKEFYKNMVPLYERHWPRRAIWLRRCLISLFFFKLTLLRCLQVAMKSEAIAFRARRNQAILESLIGSRQESLNQQPFVSVIVTTYNRVDCLIDLLNRLKKQTYDRYEVLVVDQSEFIDPVKESIYRQIPSNWKIIRVPPKGRPNAKNVGISYAKGDILLFCDDDIIPPDNLIQTHVECHNRHEVGGVSCRHTEDNRAYIRTRRICKITFYGYMIGRCHSDVTCYVDTLAGANMSIKTDLQRRLGYFESALTGTSIFEEQDFSARLIQLGYKILFTNKISFAHVPQLEGNEGIRTRYPKEYYRDFHHNEIVYFLKNRNHLCLFFVIPFCFLRSVKQAYQFKLSPRDVVFIFSGVSAGFRSYYKSLR